MARPTRQRLDQLVVERGLADSRARAQALILAGKVRTGSGDGASDAPKSTYERCHTVYGGWSNVQ